jgi:hypothetical protein
MDLWCFVVRFVWNSDRRAIALSSRGASSVCLCVLLLFISSVAPAALLYNSALAAPAQQAEVEPAAPGAVEPGLYFPVVGNRFATCSRNPNPSRFGVQMYGNTGTTGDHFLPLLESQADWVRVPIYWSSVEPNESPKGDYRWEEADAAIAVAREACVRLVVTISGSPGWAADYPEGPITRKGRFKEFIAAVVQRYNADGVNDAAGSPKINYYEFFNEPDQSPPLEPDAAWGNYATEYAEMLKGVYPIVKENNPTAMVLLGGLALDWFEEDGGPFNRQFLDEVLTAGGGQYFDIMNIHSYPAFAGYWKGSPPGLYEKVIAIRQKLQGYGLEKPFWITEAGWHSDNSPQEPSSPEQQARFVALLMAQALAADVKVLIYWMLYDPGGFYPFQPGLVNSAKPVMAKPALATFRFMRNTLAHAQFVRMLNNSETNNVKDMLGYVYDDSVNNRTIYVAWLVASTKANSQETLRINASQATVYDIYGNGKVINAQSNGQIQIKLQGLKLSPGQKGIFSGEPVVVVVKK